MFWFWFEPAYSNLFKLVMVARIKIITIQNLSYVKSMASLFKMLLRITRVPKKRLSRYISLCQGPNAHL